MNEADGELATSPAQPERPSAQPPSTGLPAGSISEYLLREGLRRPDHVAVERGDESYTYRQLADRVRTVAADLSHRGLRRGDVTIVAADPTPAALVVALACWAIGAIYVPVAPHTPARRRDTIIAMTDPAAFATERLAEATVAVPVMIDLAAGEITITGAVDRPARRAASKEAPPDAAYIIFTSGTTGVPKGITMTHRAAIAFFRGMTQEVPLPPDTRVGSIAPLSFDFSLLDWGLAGGAGATLVQIPREMLLPPRRFVDHLRRHDVTMVSGVPSVWRPVLRHAADQLAECASLSTVLLGGEPYPMDLVRALRQARPGLRVINCFGQSESIACSFLELADPVPPNLTRVPIGPAHPGAEMILLDDRGQPTVTGEAGEVFLRSPALFSGYWQDPEATARALVPPPDAPDSAERILRTGDLLRSEADGTFSFVGRADHQVKVNGNRVELEEVERVLASHATVADVAVTVVGGAVSDQLVALVVPRMANEDDTRQLRGVCRSLLPPYMVPTDIVLVPSLPHNDNDKIDRRRVREMAADAVHALSRPTTESPEQQ
ncbi:amino acid adenylation domain-containing protein [Micromonospora sp. HUAS LYJ1]|uniref:amino acid adenylation domain-containing protein n=1 Tax=Micromonospora sp. HUAS LYJ1 TaxID=3061626 RepID=UPI002672F4FE|nr:amino acid adenylation domain-containing protein [Micromonospora sp. HUAS LYJ1]WKU07126.1 amino acid adenylation domain-containing protein [Micromonospora sp. HUAS LYJ1]